MAEKHTDDKLYRVVRKDGSHLNTKVNLDAVNDFTRYTVDVGGFLSGHRHIVHGICSLGC